MAVKKSTNPSTKSRATAASASSSLKFPNDLHYEQPQFMISSISQLSPQIITIDNFFNAEYVKKLLLAFESLKLETTPLRKSREYAVRVNDRISITDEISCGNLWIHLNRLLNSSSDDAETSIKEEFGHAKGLNPNLRVYRYAKGHHFGKHFDESVKVSTSKYKGVTKWTLLIYLSGDEQTLIGGDTIFYESKDNVIRVHPKAGMALLHKHGDDCLLHEGEMVKKGVKWVLRSDVVF